MWTPGDLEILPDDLIEFGGPPSDDRHHPRAHASATTTKARPSDQSDNQVASEDDLAVKPQDSQEE